MTTSRRGFLTLTAGVAAIGALGATTATAAVGSRAGQRDWFLCDKCHGMFFNGDTSGGVCPAGGGHHTRGWNFRLPYEVRDAWHQPDWRHCEKCHGMFWHGQLFWDGQTWTGVCPSGGGHLARGRNFTLPRDHVRPDWRYCIACAGLFFAGHPRRGTCPAGSAGVPHLAREEGFVLPHLP